MRKLLNLSLYVILGLLSNLLLGCNEPNNESGNNIPDKTYEEFYNELGDTTIEMEVVLNDKRATFFYSNDEEYFVSTIKYENAQEFGFVFNKQDNILYTIDKGEVTQSVSSSIAKNKLATIFKSANYLFYLKLNKNKFVFQETVTIANRECSKYRYEEPSKNLVYNIFIDKETSLCLKCVCSKNDTVEMFFETKKFLQETNVQNYKILVYTYNESKKDTQNNNNITDSNNNIK